MVWVSVGRVGQPELKVELEVVLSSEKKLLHTRCGGWAAAELHVPPTKIAARSASPERLLHSNPHLPPSRAMRRATRKTHTHFRGPRYRSNFFAALDVGSGSFPPSRVICAVFPTVRFLCAAARGLRPESGDDLLSLSFSHVAAPKA